MIDTNYSPIDCEDYDYLEIACMDRYDVELSSKGEIVRGVALNLEVVKGEEFLILRSIDTPNSRIRIDLIDHLRVKSRPCRFQERTFGRDATNA